MNTRTITRLARPLRGAAPRHRMARTAPRPEGWTASFRDYCRWLAYLRREGRNDAAYLDRF